MRGNVLRGLVVLVALMLLGAWPTDGHAAEAARETGFINAVARLGDQSMPYVVYVPRDYTPERKWPVILFLHGAGERGDDGLAQSQVGIATAIRRNPERFPCLVIMPQCPARGRWSVADGREAVGTPAPGDLAVAALDATVGKYNGDTERLYLTGLSLGGYGTWAIATKHPTKFAALMPVCGGGQPEEMAGTLKALPIWVFHGGADEVVPADRSRAMVEALKAAGSTTVRYTEYEGVGHNSWDRAYGTAEAIVWLLQQKRL